MLSGPATSSWRTAATEPSDCLGVPSQGDGQGESQRSNLDAFALCLDVLPPAPPVTALITLCKPATMADNWSNKRRTAMPAIDVQVHPFDRNHPGRPWASPSHGLNSATGEEMVAAMNSVGVDGAIMVSSFSAYEYDPSYALEVYNTYPNKFRVVTPVAATDPAIDDVV